MRVQRIILNMMWAHVIKIIRQENGLRWIDDVYCKVIITRPEIWSQIAGDRTRKAAEWSIQGNKKPFRSFEITVISEPEAAAQAMLLDPAYVNRDDIPGLTKPGDIFLICDAGGGMVGSQEIFYCFAYY